MLQESYTRESFAIQKTVRYGFALGLLGTVGISGVFQGQIPPRGEVWRKLKMNSWVTYQALPNPGEDFALEINRHTLSVCCFTVEDCLLWDEAQHAPRPSLPSSFVRCHPHARRGEQYPSFVLLITTPRRFGDYISVFFSVEAEKFRAPTDCPCASFSEFHGGNSNIFYTLIFVFKSLQHTPVSCPPLISPSNESR